MAAVAFVLSLVVGHWLYPHLSSNNDEPIYVLQAQTFRHGHVTLSAAAHDDFFRPWMSGAHDNHLFLVVQPVLPALLAASDALFGSMRIALALIAAGAVVAVFAAIRALLKDDRIALVAAGFFTLSPFVIVQSALFLTYVLAVLLTAVVLTLVHHGLERGSRRWFGGAGLVYGVLLFTRPIEGAMLALALAVWVVARRERVRDMVLAALVMVAGTLPIVVLMLVYNRVTTGNPLRFPLWAIGGNDSFGFGDRSIAPGAPTVHYGLSQAWLTLRTNLRSFPHWMLGGLVTLPLGVWGAIIGWRAHRTATVLLGAIALIYPAGYFLYWGNYLIIAGRNEFGPHYYMALLLPAVAFVALAVDDLVRRRRLLVYALVPLLVAGTLVEVGNKIRANERYRDGVEREVTAVRAAVHDRAVVVVPSGPDGPYVLHPRGAFANGPQLSDQTLYAVDLLDRNLELFDRFPDRTIYRLQQLAGAGGPRADVRTLERRQAEEFVVDVTVTAKRGEPTVSAYVASYREFFTDCVVARDATAGETFHVVAHLTADHVTVTGCQNGDLTAPEPSGAALALGVSGGTSDNAAAGELLEQRYWVRSTGADLELVTPADTWRRDRPDQQFVAVDPDLDSLARFTLR